MFTTTRLIACAPHSLEPLEDRIAPAAVINLSDLDGANGFKISGETPAAALGHSVSDAGDVNGDGIDDLIVGAPSADPNGTDSGAAYVVFGNTAGFPAALLDLTTLDGANGFKIQGEAADDAAGIAVSGAGDLNGDDIDDLIVGAARADPNGNLSGASYVIFGKTGGFGAILSLTTLDGGNGFKIQGEAANDQSGSSVSAAGDVNGDGVADLIVGAPEAGSAGDRPGASYVVFGKSTAFTSTLNLSTLNGPNGFKIQGEAADDYAGVSVSGAGDVNGDGLDDLIVGAHLANTNAPYAGASYVVYGRSSGFGATLDLSSLDGVTGVRIQGEADSDYSGRSVSGAGDINGDGLDDLIIGAYGADANGDDSGASYVVFGNAGGLGSVLNLSTLDGTGGFKIQGAAEYDYAGFSVSGAGDVNGDGFDDLVIGAYNNGPGTSYVVFGKAGAFTTPLNLSALDGVNGFAINGEADGDASGFSVSGAGDINRDGLDDLLIGAESADGGSGASYVVFAPVPAVSIGDVTVAEGDSGTSAASFTVSLSAASTQTITVQYATTAGTAIAPEDFTALPLSTLTFAPGELSKTIVVEVRGELVFEPDEMFFVNLSNAVHATLADAQGQGTITNNDAPPTVSVGDASVAEGNTGTANATFTVSLSAASTEAITVQFATANGTAIAPEDFIAVPVSTVSFAPGEVSQTVIVEVLGDTAIEPGETFFLDLSNPTNATLADAQGRGTILDDDSPPTISVGDASIAEGNAGAVAVTFTVSLSLASTQAITVQYATANGTAIAPEDFTAIPLSTLSFAPGEVSKTITLEVLGDTVIERDETYFLDLSNPVNASLADAQGQGTIVNDDTAPEPSGVTIIKNGKAATFTDVDGDKVIVKTKNGIFTEALFDTRASGLGFQLEALDLTSAAFAQTKLMIKATPQELAGIAGLSGDARVNVGAIDATSVDLKSVKLKGDLGRIVAGDGAFDRPALKTLTISSFGALGLATQNATGSLLSLLAGSLGKLKVKGDMLAALDIVTGTTGTALGKATIKGSLGSASGGQAVIAGGSPLLSEAALIRTDADIGDVLIKGSVFAIADVSGIISGGNLGTVSIGEDLASFDPARPVRISAQGNLGATNQNAATAIAGVTVGGNVLNAQILAGYSQDLSPTNGDAGIGKVTVSGLFQRSSIVAGVADATGDGFGINDALIAGGGSAEIIARIAKVTLKGEAAGSMEVTTDHFGITAGTVARMTLGGVDLDLEGNANLILDAINNDLRLVELGS